MLVVRVVLRVIVVFALLQMLRRIGPVERRVQPLFDVARLRRLRCGEPLVVRARTAKPDSAARSKVERALVRRNDGAGWRSER